VRLQADLVLAEREYRLTMPVDLSPAGLPSAYPDHGPRFWPWLGIWAACCVLGAAIALLLWPNGEPARGAWFWFCVVGLPNGVFGILLGFARAGYEAFWFRAHYRNMHRNKWLGERVRFAQRPLQVLGVGYCLPLGDLSLAATMTAGRPLQKMQPPRNGPGMILHNRFLDSEPQLAYQTVEPVEHEDVALSLDEVRSSPTVSMFRAALLPLAASLHALSQYEQIHWPQVRVLATPAGASAREQQVRDALRIAGLPPLSCQAVPESDGLLVADAWLDAHERRPLLVIAAAWHDASPPVGSTEGCVAVLLGPGFYQLPEQVKIAGRLHRPVAGDLDELESVFANAAIWGDADAPAVTHAWISGLSGEHDRALLAGLTEASLSGVTQQETQRRPDRIVGDAGAANAWLSIAAAIESGMSGPQLIIDRAMAAILYVAPVLPPEVTGISSHDDPKN
jgi:hypothetical protein